MKKTIVVFSIFQAVITFAQNNFNVEKDHLAVKGYDVVSYFSNKPIQGKSKYSTIYDGIKYQFINASNLAMFKQNPTKYLPQYGGWCAYAMGKTGEKVNINPETYKILNGKLYLFYNKFFTNTLKEWNKDEVNLKSKADTNWKQIKK